MAKQLLVMGYFEAAAYLRDAGTARPVGILSIHGPGEPAVEGEAAIRLDLSFYDTAEPFGEPALAALQRIRERRAGAVAQGGPTAGDVQAIIRFAEEVNKADVEGAVLCHCSAGISRAPAAGLVCLAVWNGPGSEVECVRMLQAVRPAAIPHRGLVRMADELLGRQGMLVQAVAASPL